MPDFFSLSAIYLHNMIVNLSYVSALCLFAYLGCMEFFLQDNENAPRLCRVDNYVEKSFLFEHHMGELLKKDCVCLSVV